MVDTEFLNNEDCSGLPTHELILKPNTPIMLMRNLNPPEGAPRNWQRRADTSRIL